MNRSPRQRSHVKKNRSPRRRSPVKKNKSPRRKSPAKKSKSPRRKSPAKKSKSPRRKLPAKKNRSPRRKSPAKKNRSPRRKSPAKKNSRSPNRKSRKYRNILKGGARPEDYDIDNKRLAMDDLKRRIETLDEHVGGNEKRMELILKLLEELKKRFDMDKYNEILLLVTDEEDFRSITFTRRKVDVQFLERLLDVQSLDRISSVPDQQPVDDLPKRISSAPDPGSCHDYYGSRGKNRFDFGILGSFNGVDHNERVKIIRESQRRRQVYLEYEDNKLLLKLMRPRQANQDNTYVWARDSINVKTRIKNGVDVPDPKNSPHSIEVHVTTHNRARDTVRVKDSFYTHVTVIKRGNNPNNTENYHLGTRVYTAPDGLEYYSPVVFWSQNTDPNIVSLTDHADNYIFPFHNNVATLLREFYNWARTLCIPTFFAQLNGALPPDLFNVSLGVFPALPDLIPVYIAPGLIKGSIQIPAGAVAPVVGGGGVVVAAGGRGGGKGAVVAAAGGRGGGAVVAAAGGRGGGKGKGRGRGKGAVVAAVAAAGGRGGGKGRGRGGGGGGV